MTSELKPIYDTSCLRRYNGRFKVQLEIPEGSNLTEGEIEQIGRLASWDINPNGYVLGYEGGRSVLIEREVPETRQGLTLAALQISGIGYKNINFGSSCFKGSPVGFYDDSEEFFPPSSQNFMDRLAGTSLMTTSYSMGGIIQKSRPGYRALGTYTMRELSGKIKKTIRASGFRLKNLITSEIKAYGRYLDSGLSNEDGSFGFLITPVPYIGKERVGSELQDGLIGLIRSGSNLQEFFHGSLILMQNLIIPMIRGLRELHDVSRVAHLQTHLSNYYIVDGLPYLMDWSTLRDLGNNKEDNIFHRSVDLNRPRENLAQFLSFTLGKFVNPEFLNNLMMASLKSSLEEYIGDSSNEIEMLDLVNRTLEVLGPNAREFHMVMQFLRDQGFEGNKKYILDQKPKDLPSYFLTKKNPHKLIKEERIGRNDSCPCGSGKKYKHCCLRK